MRMSLLTSDSSTLCIFQMPETNVKDGSEEKKTIFDSSAQEKEIFPPFSTEDPPD